MRRRDILLAATMLAPALPAPAQQPPARVRIGWISIVESPFVNAFREGMRDRGYVEGQNLSIEYRFAKGHAGRLPDLVAELVASRVDAIVATGSATVSAAWRGHATIPVVFVSADPNSFGVPLNFPRPQDNVTGTALMFEVLVTKWVELMHELIPAATQFAVLTDDSIGNRQQATAITKAAQTLSIDVLVLQAAALEEFKGAFQTATESKAGAMMVASSPSFGSQTQALVDLANSYRLPAIYDNSDFVRSGGLLSFGPDFVKVFRDLADYVVRVLRGTPVASLPVVQPTKFVLSINTRTAKALGVAIPPALLARADEVIE
jgi:putative ABC transport system substrate-binding protein